MSETATVESNVCPHGLILAENCQSCDREMEQHYRDLEAIYEAKLNREIRDHYAMLDHIDEERGRDHSLDLVVTS